jgi:hypothetical protein
MDTIDAEQFDSLPSFKSIGQTCGATRHLLHCDVELFGFRILLFLNADAAFANHFARVFRTRAEPNAERTDLTSCCLADLLSGISLGSLFD